MTATFIELSAVAKTYPSPDGPVEAVSDISLMLNEGEFVALLGPSGCGKSTLLLMLAGLTQPTSGSIAIDGTQITKPFTDLGIVFQNAELLPWRDALANVTLQTEIRKVAKGPARQRALDLMAQVGLTGFEHRYPDELSGGMAQRVALCRALLHDPNLIVMDEPFGALDALTRDQIQLDMQKLWMTTNKTVVLVTHSIDEAVFLADRIIVFTPRPAKIAADIRVPFSRPRRASDRTTAEFTHLVKEIRDIFTDLGVLEEAAV